MSKGRSQETGDRRQEKWGMSEKAGKRIIPLFFCLANPKSSLFELPRRKTLCFFKT
ncbi:MAG: hypothetical protein AB4080_16215 [Trichodesmium sp.]